MIKGLRPYEKPSSKREHVFCNGAFYLNIRMALII
jgi:hypothetical protein